MSHTSSLTHDTPRLFTPGPTVTSQHILDLAAHQLPYNRTESFSQLTFEILDGLKYLFATRGDVVIFAASGTGAMEASVFNFIHREDRALIVNGGTFGQRWVDLCMYHDIPFTEINLAPGADVPIEMLEQKLSAGNFSTLLLNAHETSTGQLYDTRRIGELAHERGVLFIVDAISTLCADPFEMDDWQVDVCILSSQKGLALPPGLSFLALNDKAKERLGARRCGSLYFDIQDYLENQKRGQMPFTPVIGHFLMLHEQLKRIRSAGVDSVIAGHQALARYFRDGINDLPFDFVPDTPSNALTALRCEDCVDAFELTQRLASEYNCIVAPNGGPLKHEMFRVSHLGEQTTDDLEFLVNAIKSILTPRL